ncbi:MAG: hypothetical protein TH68_03145 [Candidatus Synechococcus spongiarum 142]|uniref:Uncharacterized protein n=1 Tax=Candidatus Synechococcus spongiarum 142 TaxID=1608213 RepID=A0A6N3X4K1_9SYNE|nr:MAG: hypothetical protein TH68_03145 [Candidatus Synechococcus spongiarum 142]
MNFQIDFAGTILNVGDLRFLDLTDNATDGHLGWTVLNCRTLGAYFRRFPISIVVQYLHGGSSIVHGAQGETFGQGGFLDGYGKSFTPLHYVIIYRSNIEFRVCVIQTSRIRNIRE